MSDMVRDWCFDCHAWTTQESNWCAGGHFIELPPSSDACPSCGGDLTQDVQTGEDPCWCGVTLRTVA